MNRRYLQPPGNGFIIPSTRLRGSKPFGVGSGFPAALRNQSAHRPRAFFIGGARELAEARHSYLMEVRS